MFSYQGGGQIYESLIDKVDTIHISIVHTDVEGDIIFPTMPDYFKLIFEQYYKSNIDYTYQIWKR